MKLLSLNAVEQALTGYTHKVNLTFADLTTAGLTQIINILPTGTKALVAGMGIRRSALKLITPFTGGAIASCALDVGDGASVGRYIANANTDLFTALATNTKPHVVGGAGYIYSPKNISDGNVNVTAKFTTTTGNVNAATAGECDIYLCLEDYNGLAVPASS